MQASDRIGLQWPEQGTISFLAETLQRRPHPTARRHLGPIVFYNDKNGSLKLPQKFEMTLNYNHNQVPPRACLQRYQHANVLFKILINLTPSTRLIRPFSHTWPDVLAIVEESLGIERHKQSRALYWINVQKSEKDMKLSSTAPTQDSLQIE